VGSNPTQNMEVCVSSEVVLSCVGRGVATGRSPVQGVLSNVCKQNSEGRPWASQVCVPCCQEVAVIISISDT
jgi:hypothetical protein